MKFAICTFGIIIYIMAKDWFPFEVYSSYNKLFSADIICTSFCVVVCGIKNIEQSNDARKPCISTELVITEEVYDKCCSIRLYKKVIVAKQGSKQEIRSFGVTVRELMEMPD